MKRPINPHLVLLLAILLPGGGHVALGEIRRGFGYASFTILFFFLTYLTTHPDQGFVARHAGGLFVWALSLPDAYRRARMRFVVAQAEEGR